MGSQWSNKSNCELDNKPSELCKEQNQFKTITKRSECQEAVHDEMGDKLINDKYTVERSNKELTDTCCAMKKNDCTQEETIDELNCSFKCTKNAENCVRNNFFVCTEQLACKNAEIKVNCKQIEYLNTKLDETRRTSTGFDQKLQETKSTLERETCLPEKLNFDLKLCGIVKELNCVTKTSHDEIMCLKSTLNCARKYQQESDEKNQRLRQKIKKLQCIVEGFEIQQKNQNYLTNMLQKNNVVTELELSESIEKNKMLETRTQQVACQNEELKTLRTEKEELECKNNELTDICCTMKKDYGILKETLACTGQELQETKLALKRESCLREKLNEAYEQLKDEFAYVSAKLETTGKTLACTEQKLSIASVNLNTEIYKNKQLTEKNDKLENEYTCVVEKCDKMAASLSYTQQKLDDTESKFCKRRELHMENDRLSHMCELLKKELEDVAEKLSCAELTLQQTVLKLKEETCKKNRLFHIYNFQREQIAYLNEQLDIMYGVYDDVGLEKNEKISKEKNPIEKRNELETMYACLVEEHSTFNVDENAVDVKSQLNE